MSTPAAPPWAGADVAVPLPPDMPGLRLRHYRGPADHPGMIDVNNAARRGAGVVERVSIETMDSDYASLSNSDPFRDVIVAEVADGIVGYGRNEWSDNSDGGRDYASFGLLDPAFRRRGIGTAMLRWQEARSVEIASGQLTDRPRFHFSFVYDGDPGGLALLAGAGYAVVRRGAEMVRPTLDDVPDAPLPDGLAFRVSAADDARAVWDADTEIFRDHWGANDESEARFQQFATSPKFDPSLWVVAYDGAEIAGLVLTALQPDDAPGETVGYLDSVGVRRPWRRRGLGRALVAEALRVVRSRGATSAGLGVDLQNQNEAARLYESVGFRIESTMTEFRKQLPV